HEAEPVRPGARQVARRPPRRVRADAEGAPVPVPAGAELLAASAPLDDDGAVPTDVTVWVRA
ncbi:alpha-glucosidase, partial [Micromonospora sp. NPDC005113]